MSAIREVIRLQDGADADRYEAQLGYLVAYQADGRRVCVPSAGFDKARQLAESLALASPGRSVVVYKPAREFLAPPPDVAAVTQEAPVG